MSYSRVFRFTRMQEIQNMMRRVSFRWRYPTSELNGIYLSTLQKMNLKELYVRLPSKLKQLVGWHTIVDVDDQVAGPRQIEDVIHSCKNFRYSTDGQKSSIEEFVSTLDVMLDPKKDAVIDELVQLYPKLSPEVRERIPLREGVIDSVNRGGVEETQQFFHKIVTKIRDQLRGTNASVTNPVALDMYPVLSNFVHLLDGYPGTGYGCNRLPYVYRSIGITF